MNAWLVMTVRDDDREHYVPNGYDDRIGKRYEYDNYVPNHTRVLVGDVLFFRDKIRMLGYGRVQRITFSDDKPKKRVLCPQCGSNKIRLKKSDPSLKTCRECKFVFRDGKIRHDPCRVFQAEIEGYEEINGTYTISDFQGLCTKLNKQNAINLIDRIRDSEILKTLRLA